MVTLYETIEYLCRLNEINVTYMCRESGASRASMTDLKKGRSTTLTAETLDKIARYFHVPIEFLIDDNEDKFDYLGKGDLYERVRSGEQKKPLVNDDEELTELLERARDDPHIRMLFSVTKDATPEDIQKAIKIIQTLKGG
ncbi:MAG: helix-turn-helix transcriptional regulator [Oscillospiraceae bacterium]|nr:helix-turn-helix transcriptional regulator [Oscillospiraceae bacterium]